MILRELFVKLGLDLDEQAFAKGELAAELVKGALEKVVDVAKELTEAFVDNIKEVIEYGDELNKAAQASGIARDALQELRYVAQLADVSNEEFSASLNILTRTMRAARDGSDEQAKAFQKLGIKVTDARGKLRGADDVISDIAENLADLPDGAEKTALAMQFFGRAGAKMIPILNQGADGIEELRKEARDLGLVMDDEAVKASEELNDNLTRLHMISRGLWRQAIAPLIPAINELVVRFLKWRRENAAIMAQKIQKYVGYVVTAVTKLSDGFSFLLRNAAAIKAMLITGLVYAFSQVSTAATIAAARTALAWVAAAAPFVALAALIAGILLVFDDIRVYQQGGKSLYGRFKKEIDDWVKPREKDTWFVAAIKDFVRLIQQAIDLIDEFYKATGRVNPREVDRKAGLKDKEVQRRADVMTQESARRRVQLGLPLTDEEKAALTRTGASPEAFVNKYAPKGPLAPPTPAQLAAQQGPVFYRPDTPAPLVVRQGGAPVTVQVYPAPGMSEEQVGQIVADKVQEHWDNQMEAAAAAAGP